MTIRWMPDGKVDRWWRDSAAITYSEANQLADALDECVASLQSISQLIPTPEFVNERQVMAKATLLKIGVEP